MKNIISLILVMICFSSQVYAEPINIIKQNKKSFSLPDTKSGGLVSVEISKDEKYLPDFSAYPFLEEINVDANNPYYSSIDGVLYTKNKKTLICYPKNKKQNSFTVPEEVGYIISGAFSQNTHISDILLSAELTGIGANPFSKCSNLNDIKISPYNNYFTVENGILYNKNKTILYACPPDVLKLRVPDSVIKIAYGAFSGCSRLQEILLPEQLMSIESMAFNSCTSLSEITIPGNIETVTASCFTGCSKLEAIKAEKSDYFKSFDGILYSYDMIDLICCPNGKSGIITIPDGVVNILNGAFDNCSKITTVIFPKSVKYAARSFLNCTSLKNIEMPENQAIIEYGTFAGCSSLEWIYLPNNIVIIQDGAFSGCNPLILCDEGSFAEYYSEENSISFQYKYNISSNNTSLYLQKQPFENNGRIYFPLAETVEVLGGQTFFDYGTSLNADLNDISVKFTMKKAEKTKSNQTEIIDFIDIIYNNKELYISADEFAKMFDYTISKNGHKIEINK